VFLGFLRRQKSPFKPPEKRLIDAVADALPPDAHSLLLEQVREVNRVWRDPSGKEVNLYRIRRGRPCYDGVRMFPLTTEEVRLARIHCRVPGRKKLCRVEFWLVRGWFFSLHFTESLKGVDPDQLEIREVKLLTDPMTPGRPQISQPLAVDSLSGWVREWAQERQATGLAAPLPAPERDRLVGQIEAALPSDYLELVAQTEGLQVGGWRVFGVSEIRSVVMTETNCYVLAESEAPAWLVVREGEPTARLYFMEHDEQGGRDMGSSLREAVERLPRHESL